MAKTVLKKLLVLFALATMVISGGCGSNDDSAYTFYSDKAAIDAYIGNKEIYVNRPTIIGHIQGEKGDYYFVQEVEESGNVIIHIAVVTENEGIYSCEKYSPDYSFEAVSPDGEMCRYVSIPFEDNFLNIGVLESNKYSVRTKGEELEVNKAGVFYHVDKTDDVIFNCSTK